MAPKIKAVDMYPRKMKVLQVFKDADKDEALTPAQVSKLLGLKSPKDTFFNARIADIVDELVRDKRLRLAVSDVKRHRSYLITFEGINSNAAWVAYLERENRKLALSSKPPAATTDEGGMTWLTDVVDGEVRRPFPSKATRALRADPEEVVLSLSDEPDDEDLESELAAALGKTIPVKTLSAGRPVKQIEPPPSKVMPLMPDLEVPDYPIMGATRAIPKPDTKPFSPITQVPLTSARDIGMDTFIEKYAVDPQEALTGLVLVVFEMKTIIERLGKRVDRQSKFIEGIKTLMSAYQTG